jgi:hypothetical protein
MLALISAAEYETTSVMSLMPKTFRRIAQNSSPGPIRPANKIAQPNREAAR